MISIPPALPLHYYRFVTSKISPGGVHQQTLFALGYHPSLAQPVPSRCVGVGSYFFFFFFFIFGLVFFYFTLIVRLAFASWSDRCLTLNRLF